ncbi:MAG: NAD(P)-dependent oxidoreductase [Nonlabens sp.]
MKIAVFGGTGLVGKVLIEYLLKENHEVVCISRLKQNPTVPTFNIDVSKESEFENITFTPEIVLNCSSLTPQQNKTSTQPDFVADLFKVNAVGGVNIANWAVKKNARLVINYSTLVTVKKPWPVHMSEEYNSIPDGFHTAYCMSKLSQEQLMTNATITNDIKTIHLRLSAVYGNQMPSNGLIHNFFNQLKIGEDLKLTNGNKVFLNFIHTDDIARITTQLLKVKIFSGVYNCASSQEISILELASNCKSIINATSKILNIDEQSSVSRASINNDKLKNLLGENFLYEKYSFKTRLSELAENYFQ